MTSDPEIDRLNELWPGQWEKQKRPVKGLEDVELWVYEWEFNGKQIGVLLFFHQESWRVIVHGGPWLRGSDPYKILQRARYIWQQWYKEKPWPEWHIENKARGRVLIAS